MKTITQMILTLFAAVVFLSCAPKPAPSMTVPAGARAGELTGLNACDFQARGKKQIFAAECGTLAVPENWDKANSRLIALPVVRIPATGPNPAEPVFYLQGGPGGPNLVWTPPDWLLKNHDVVMVGYRGAEGTVVLACPEISRLLKIHLGKDLYSEQARLDYIAATKQCAASYQQAGVDLSGYTIPGVVQDTEAARKALGYHRINLFSESYGTRVAQIYAYMHPDSLQRLVLIGVNTPGHFIYDPAVLDQLIKHLSELCAKDVNCRNRTGNFADTMYAVNHNMPTHWLIFNIDPDTIRMATHFMYFSSSSMPLIFDAYLAAAKGDPSGLAMMNLIMPMMMDPDSWIWGDMFSKAVTADLEKYDGMDSVGLKNSILGAPHSELIWPMAAVWPIKLIPKELREFQQSDVEMLLINGTVDFSTPPTALDEARTYYHRAQMVLLPEFSHVNDEYTIQPAAFERLITSYYDTGVADDSLYTYQPLSFEQSMSPTAMAKLLVGAIILVPLFVFFGIALVVRRVRKRSAAKTSTTIDVKGFDTLGV